MNSPYLEMQHAKTVITEIGSRDRIVPRFFSLHIERIIYIFLAAELIPQVKYFLTP